MGERAPTASTTIPGWVPFGILADDWHGLGRRDIVPGAPVFLARDGIEVPNACWLSPRPVLCRLIALASAWFLAVKDARHGAANTLVPRGCPSSFREALSQALEPSRSPSWDVNGEEREIARAIRQQ